MTDIGEAVAVSVITVEGDKCIFCGESHEAPKVEEIKAVAPSNKNWQRPASMQGTFESIAAKEAIYPGNKFPPSYPYQGHHCLALSAFSFNSNSSTPSDKNKKLNHFLNKVGFFPNRGENCIGLPARKSYGAFKPFWEALDENKPLQLHGPGHDNEYFLQCDKLVARLRTIISNVDLCKENSHQEMEDDLKELIAQAENYAFIQLCAIEDGWELHEEERKLAESIYRAPKLQGFTVRGANKTTRTEMGKGHLDHSIKYPSPSLDTGPF